MCPGKWRTAANRILQVLGKKYLHLLVYCMWAKTDKEVKAKEHQKYFQELQMKARAVQLFGLGWGSLPTYLRRSFVKTRQAAFKEIPILNLSLHIWLIQSQIPWSSLFLWYHPSFFQRKLYIFLKPISISSWEDLFSFITLCHNHSPTQKSHHTFLCAKCYADHRNQ